jgi:endonuclease/exonuclease/phosphatase family metal-dependent hydrolase
VKLISLNIGIKIENTPQINTFLTEQDADIIALQEVSRPLEDAVVSVYRTQPDIMATLRETHPYSFFAPLWAADAFRFDGDIARHFGGHIEQGNEVYSKFPIASATNEFYYRHFEYILDWANWKQTDHGRAVQIVELTIKDQSVQILNLHGIWNQSREGDDRTMRQCEYLVAVAARKDMPTIICGDFNLTPDSASIQYLDKYFRNLTTEFSIRATRPDFKDAIDTGNEIVDYIFVDKRINVNDFSVIETDISDHFPLVLDFDVI